MKFISTIGILAFLLTGFSQTSKSGLKTSATVVEKWSFAGCAYSYAPVKGLSISAGLRINTTRLFSSYYRQTHNYFYQPYAAKFGEYFSLTAGLRKNIFSFATESHIYLSYLHQFGVSSVAYTTGFAQNSSFVFYNYIDPAKYYGISQLSAGFEAPLNERWSLCAEMGWARTYGYYFIDYDSFVAEMSATYRFKQRAE